jgi:hypothetical protein
MGMWRRRRKAASAGLSAALYSVRHEPYSEAVVSSVASAVALVEVGRFREAVEYVQKAARALYEAARDVFEQVKITVQRLVELFVKAVARVLAWVDEHKAHLFLMAVVAAGAVALNIVLDMWGLIEHGKLAYAASLTPFIPAGVDKYSREEAFKILREAPDPYEKFREVAKAANAGRVRLAEPWESLRVLIMPKRSEEERLMKSKAYRELDEGKKKALFYAVLALEEAFGVYRTVLREVAEGLKKVMQRVEVGEGPFKRVVYMADVGQIKQLAEVESNAFEDALSTLRKRLNEYAVKYGLRDHLDVNEGVARELAEAERAEFSEFSGVNFGVKAYATLIAYREYALGRRGAYGIAAGYWLEMGGSAWLLYYAPSTAYLKAERAKVKRPAAAEEVVAEALRRLFLKPGAVHHRGFVELLGSGRLALMPERGDESSYVFKLYNMKESGELDELGISLWIAKVGKGEGAGITYALTFDDVKRWRRFFKQELEAAEKAAEEVGRRLPVEDRFPYMLGWVDSDVAISGGRLEMSTSHLWQLAETHALFGWPDIVVFRVNLTLEGPKPQFYAYTSLEKLDETIMRSAEGGWLRLLGAEAGLEDLMHVKSWEGLKQWVAKNWGIVVNTAESQLRKVLNEEELKRLLAPEGGDVAKRRKGGQVAPRDGENVWEELRRRLEALRDRLNDDKIAREVVAPALLLIQAERLGVNETTLRYLAAVASGAIGGDGHVSAAMGEVGLARGKLEDALLWAAVFAAHGIRAKVRDAGSALQVIVSGGDAARLAGLYFLFGPPLLEGGDDRLKSHKLAEAVELAAEGLDIRWEELRLTKSGVAADLTISEGGIAVKYNVYLRNDITLQFHSTDCNRAELAARLLRLAGVNAEVKKEGSRDVWYIEVSTDMLAAGREDLRKALAEVVRRAMENRCVDADRAKRWLEKLEGGITLMEGWPKYYVGLSGNGALVVRFGSTNSDNIVQETQRLKKMGLVEGVHFVVKMPEEGRYGYVSILREGLAYAAWLSVYGEGEQQRLAAAFVEIILQRAEKAGNDVHEKAKEIVKEGKERGSLTLKGFEKKVEVGGKEYVVKVIDGRAEFEESESGKLLLRIWIMAEVDGIKREYVITFGRFGKSNRAEGYAYARPDDREEDAKRLAAVVEALTGKKPKIRRKSDGTIELRCGRDHLDGLTRFAELANAIAKWLEETRR